MPKKAKKSNPKANPKGKGKGLSTHGFTAKGTPVAEVASPLKDTPVAEVASPSKATHVAGEASPLKATPVTEEASPVTEETPVAEEATPLKATPVTEDTPVATPVTEEASPVNATPIAKPAATSKAISATLFSSFRAPAPPLDLSTSAGSGCVDFLSDAGRTKCWTPPNIVKQQWHELSRKHSDISHNVCVAWKRLASKRPDNALHVASICTGSGNAEACIQQVEHFYTSSKIDTEVRSTLVFMCEIDGTKQQFILDNFVVPLLFRDALDLDKPNAYDVISKTPQRVPSSDFFSGGTSCKDFSSLSTKGKTCEEDIVRALKRSRSDRDADEDELKGTSAPTLRAWIAYIKKNKPAFIMLENVVKIRKFLHLLVVVIHELGYCLNDADVSPHRCGLKQTRARVYCFGFHVLQCCSETMDSDELAAFEKTCNEKFKDTVQCMCASCPVWEFDDLTMPVGSDLLEFWTKSLQQAGAASHYVEEGDKKIWQREHDELFAGAPLFRKRPTAAELKAFRDKMNKFGGIQFGLLPLRSQELIFHSTLVLEKIYSEYELAQIDDICIDVSQSSYRMPTREDGAPCFTGTSIIWRLKKQLILLGFDKMTFQCTSPETHKKMNSYSDRKRCSLSGNSFNGTCFLLAFGTGFSTSPLVIAMPVACA